MVILCERADELDCGRLVLPLASLADEDRAQRLEALRVDRYSHLAPHDVDHALGRKSRAIRAAREERVADVGRGENPRVGAEHARGETAMIAGRIEPLVMRRR